MVSRNLLWFNQELSTHSFLIALSICTFLFVAIFFMPEYVTYVEKYRHSLSSCVFSSGRCCHVVLLKFSSFWLFQKFVENQKLGKVILELSLALE